MARQTTIEEIMGTVGDDERCPHCGGRVRTWKKALISTAVASLCRLVAMYRWEAVHHDDFTVLAKDRNFSQLKFWDLVEAEVNNDPAKRSSGRWHPTTRGIMFVEERLVVPKYVITRANIRLRFEGPFVGVREALGTRFDYSKLIEDQEAAA